MVARNFLFLDGTTRDFSSNLPLLLINTDGQAIQADVAPGSPRVEGSLTIIDTFRGRSSLRATPDFQGLAGFEIYGQTSAGFPKKPIRIERRKAPRRWGLPVACGLLGGVETNRRGC